MTDFIELQKRFDELMLKLTKEHQLAMEELTQRQFVLCIRQAIECGDFRKHIYMDMQQIYYIPFARQHELECEIKRLKGICEANDININEYQ